MSKREALIEIACKYLGKKIDEEKLKELGCTFLNDEYAFFYDPEQEAAKQRKKVSESDREQVDEEDESGQEQVYEEDESGQEQVDKEDKSKYEIDMNLISGLLWEYDVSFKKNFVGGTYREKAISLTIKNLEEKTYYHQFLELAEPNERGIATVKKEDFGKGSLRLGNGGTWCRGSSKLAKVFIVKRNKNGKSIQSVQLAGWNREIPFSQRIKKEIADNIKKCHCVMTGVIGKSENTEIEVDHKDGRKLEPMFRDIANQKEEWFQPLCKAANDFKRQKCKECKESNKRWSAANIKGFEDFPFYDGTEEYEGTCVGCYLYDPVAYRKAFREFIKSKTVKK